jgi:hypothetical protein
MKNVGPCGWPGRRHSKMLQHFLEMLDNSFFCSNFLEINQHFLKNVGFLNYFCHHFG